MAVYKIKEYPTICRLEIFVINGVDGDEEDFVDNYDHAPEMAEDYGCGDRRADILPHSKRVLEKYKINPDEYEEIAAKVAEAVSFGCCNNCA